ncbi:sn-glycerol-3-phosphate ABC transporter ATP-binding protein UgpC [Massilia sp. W12]|uniref:ABC transporter ATP-binding protein n=1 Tax=Massilia sp. W12 TaxID=3126507 RepID=UPI0030CE9A1F
MSNVHLRGIQKSYGATQVISGIDLEIADGEFVVFVGPSGCGKSSMLRMIAGLEEISDGDLLIGGQRANDLAPIERGAAMVFQNYALYPHMTVAQNMGFALKIAGSPAGEVEAAVQRAAKILRIGHLLQRKPKALSGGERQRVAIGRAIVRKPRVFLFDEPLSNLDAALRVQMRLELTRLHRELGATMIYVTHDQVEAMTMGERIVVFNHGRIEQSGSPLELYKQPANLFVAGFLGSPKMNFLPCRALSFVPQKNDGAALPPGVREVHMQFGGGADLVLPLALERSHLGLDVTLGVRAEHLQLGAVGQGLPGTVDLCEHLGDVMLVWVQLSGMPQPIAVKLPGNAPPPAPGTQLGVLPDPAHCHVFDKQGVALR